MTRAPTENDRRDNDEPSCRRKMDRSSGIRRGLIVVRDLAQLSLRFQGLVNDEEPAPDGVRLFVLACKTLCLIFGC